MLQDYDSFFSKQTYVGLTIQDYTLILQNILFSAHFIINQSIFDSEISKDMVAKERGSYI